MMNQSWTYPMNLMIENEKIIENKIEDKHKNPDLMLKSVDRLTQELVSTAEYLRKNALDEVSEQKMSNSISNNTWNDEISFPSISMTAPMIGSTNDEATFATDQICPLPEEKSEKFDNNQINDITPTNEQYKFEMIEKDDEYKEQKQNKDVHDSPSPIIDFKVGGEIASQPSVSNKISYHADLQASIH
ncbi:hypothetical protein PVAND_007846 [Polypedilum vanderplanki]|uniref:Uncharacterized protein n=1 Tax=Polypedilum vanderplanki TaxID=319348 RepID=A0A9J6C855_POLVA|nr:hypothetical protein PVAND_007846 [Polypedilum vanderplanki]